MVVLGKMENIEAVSGRREAAFFPIVDVLRALSVVAVVAYHAGMPGLSGGYVGVDVFFVISGFLIIRQIVNEHQRGNFSWTGFWARRVLRILPTYLLVIVVSSLIALYVLVMPDEFREFGRQVAWSAGMVVNHLFLGEQGYFDTAAESKPLLHLWSLAVEEQFYLFAPIILGLLCWLARPRFGKVGRGVVAALVAAMFVASLWLCIRYTAQDEDAKNYAFFMMPLRAWEFMLGGLVPFAVPYLRRLPAVVMPFLLLAGFAMVLGAILGFNHDTLFPYWNAALPALGATLVIAAGLAAPDMRLAKGLAIKPVLSLGLLSYAWYLWHWPLMAFSRVYNFGELPLAWGVGLALLSLLLAWMSYRCIEEPIKNWRQRARPKLGVNYVVFGVLACIAVAVAGQGMARKLPEKVQSGIPEGMLPASGAYTGSCDLVGMASDDKCRVFLRKARPEKVGLVMGDSFSRAAVPEIEAIANPRGHAVVMLSQDGCAPLLTTTIFSNNGKRPYGCHTGEKDGYRWISRGSIKPDYAILISRWNSFTPWRTAPMGDGRTRRLLGRGKSPASDQKAEFVRSLRATIDLLQADGVERILIVQQSPELMVPPSECTLRARKYGMDEARRCGVPLARVLARREFSVPWITKAIQAKAGIRVIDPMPVFCDRAWCSGVVGDEVSYRDTNHLTNAGMRRVIERYAEDFAWVMGED